MIRFFHPSDDSQKRAHRRLQQADGKDEGEHGVRHSVGGACSKDAEQQQQQQQQEKQEGVALVMVMIAIAILTVFLADFQQSTRTGFTTATTQRDTLRAEYMAKSALNLTRLLVAQEPTIRRAITPVYRSLVRRRPPQVPVWNYAEWLLRPFCDNAGSDRELDEEFEEGRGVLDLSEAQGLGVMPGRCTVVSVAENSKINVNQLAKASDTMKRNIGLQMFAMMDGARSPSPYDALFSGKDADGQLTTRQDVISSLIDWWDADNERTYLDPAAGTINNLGSEDNVYARFDDDYTIKNAPFDSIEEIRLVRGVGDDFWATFVEPEPDSLTARTLTVYGSGLVNPNEAPPAVLLARLCSFLDDQSLCTDPLESIKFIQLLNTARSLIPVPFFTASRDFINFLEGKGHSRDLYPTLRSLLGEDSELLFKPVVVSREKRREMGRSFITRASILSIEATGTSGKAQVKLHAVVDFNPRWTPPAPNPSPNSNGGTASSLGVFYYYRMD